MKTSESVAKIGAALKKFQENVGNVPKTATNPHFKSKFAPLDEIVAVINQKGPEFGLSHIQSVGSIGVTTRVMHDSGEWIESDPLSLSPDKATPQGEGSAITYARRYQLPAMYGLATEEDDDANAVSGKPQSAPANAKPQVEVDPTGWDAIVASYTEHNTREKVLAELGNPTSGEAAKAAYDALSKPKKAVLAVIAVGGSVK
jgi:hypothetical protein